MLIHNIISKIRSWHQKDEKTFFGFLFLYTILLSITLYFPARHIGFLSDDWGYVFSATHTSALKAFSFFWTPDAFGNGLGNFRPLSAVLTSLIWRPFIAHPSVLHILSMALHGIVAGLVGILTYYIYKNKKTALIAALIFVLFPLNTEVVLWLCSSNSLFAAIPLLLALIVYTKYDNKTLKQCILLTVFVILSLSAKEHALVFPILILGIDLLLKRKINWNYIAYFILIDILYFGWRFAVIGSLGGYKTMEQSSTHLSVSLEHIITYIKLPVAYVYAFFNQGVVPDSFALIAQVFSLVLIITAFVYILKQKNIRSEATRNILLLGILVYVSHALGWNLYYPTGIHNEHARMLYVTTMFATILIATLFHYTNASKLRYVFYLYIFMLLPLSIFQTQPWITAGNVSERIKTQVTAELDKHEKINNIHIEHLPDQYKGAFIFRNGMDYVIAEYTNTMRNEIPFTKTMQSSTEHPIVIKVE